MIVCQSYVLPRHHNTLIVILESDHFSKERGSEAVDLVTTNVPPSLKGDLLAIPFLVSRLVRLFVVLCFDDGLTPWAPASSPRISETQPLVSRSFSVWPLVFAGAWKFFVEFETFCHCFV